MFFVTTTCFMWFARLFLSINREHSYTLCEPTFLFSRELTMVFWGGGGVRPQNRIEERSARTICVEYELLKVYNLL